MTRTVEDMASIDSVIVQEFSMQDPFNTQNMVEGLIYKNNDQYGDLEIHAVNGIECKQYITRHRSSTTLVS